VSTIPDHPVAVESPDEYERFCGAPGFSPVSRATLARQRPDALWMLAGEGQSVSARCALWWEHTPSHAGHRVGLIGHYAARDAQAAARLLERAGHQLAERGCTLAVGPMDGSTWQNYRMIVERGPEPPFFMEPDHPAEWPGHFLASGFVVLARYYSALNTDLLQQDRGVPDVLRHVEEQVFRPCDPVRVGIELEWITTTASGSLANRISSAGGRQLPGKNRPSMPMRID
jgi:hypothetical protein